MRSLLPSYVYTDSDDLSQILIVFHSPNRWMVLYCTVTYYEKMSSISSRGGFLVLWALFSFRSSAVVRELEGCLARVWFFTTTEVTTRDEEGPGAEGGGA
jgi:hypothetical protein